jgi:CubicO group peptidase (beta-lactamase class C family)
MNLNYIQKIHTQFTSEQGPGYAVGIMKGGNLVFSQTYGYANIEDQILISNQTNFRLASVSKQFIAAGILILLQRKKLSLEDTLTKFFPEFPEYGKVISIYHLLTHTSGLRDYEDLLPKDQVSQIHDEGVLNLLMAQQDGLFLPGTKYSYSNGGYCLLRMIVEKVSGQAIGNFLEKEVFTPLGMEGTVVNYDGKTLIKNRAYGYSYLSNEFVRTDQDKTSATIGDGGIYSSIGDLRKWDRAIYTDIILSKETKALMLKKHIITDEGKNIYYGLGLCLKEKDGRQIVYHGGSSIDFRQGYITYSMNR